MNPLVLLGAKVLLAGLFVALLSHLTGAAKPKLFTGLFAAAPSVAAVSLMLTVAAKPAEAAQGAEGMIAGSFGMLASCMAVALLETRVQAIGASAVGWVTWGAAALAAYVVLFR